jgi:aryl-alcohol dehydrogenase (NADP+)
MDYVDLYQIHRFDPDTPIEETLEALHDIVKAGKARYIGASSMAAWQFAKMLYTTDQHGWTRFVSMQNHYNLVYREEEREMLPLCREEGIGVIPWSPLARGFLAGNRRKDDRGDTSRAKTDTFAHNLYYADADFAVAGRVVQLAARLGVKPTQVALAWLLSKPAVTAPIVGASTLSHLDDAVASLTIKLSPEDVAFVEEPYQPHPVLGFDATRPR